MVLSIAACGSSSTDQKGNEQVDKVDQGQDAANNNDSKEDEGQDGDIVPQSDLSKRVTQHLHLFRLLKVMTIPVSILLSLF